MKIYVSAKAAFTGDGSQKKPFRTISEAARIAEPGDEVIVAPGIYREHVDPAIGGTEEKRIVYRSEKKGGAVITGAEPVKNWERQGKTTVWKARVDNAVFGDCNPFTTLVRGDWFIASMIAHIGEVYLNDKSLYEVTSLDKVKKPVKSRTSWDPDFSVYTWYAEQDEKKNETVIWANFHKFDPNREKVEINVRRACFYPTAEGRNYITLSGFKIEKAATQWAPPTAYQEGMVGPHWSKGWIIEDCEISNSKCSGISLGKYLQPENDNKWLKQKYKDGTQTERDCICQAQREGWTKERIGSHIIRRCEIHDCGQTGIVGHLGGVFSLIEDNHIHHINNKQNLAGAEIGGNKMHAAIDCVYRRNHIHHCTRGMWLDWQAQGTRVTQNFFHDNTLPFD
ncbi:MAG: right-handed parallel beta-helix repeat-containing protein, partial [Lachnospiraceae bacterium]|nr:right-handed parallel beta-helix repeat-containing protein [Lachnospiraceae bacterium]